MAEQPALTLSGEPVSRVVGGVLGLTGFSTALFVGMAIGNPPVITLGRGLLCMLACGIVGRVLGWAGAVATTEFLERYRAERPKPQPPAELIELQERRNRHKQIVEEMKRAA